MNAVDTIADLRLENEMLLKTVHELYEKVKELSSENEDLRKELGVTRNVGE